jgi:hypothetical protein
MERAGIYPTRRDQGILPEHKFHYDMSEYSISTHDISQATWGDKNKWDLALKSHKMKADESLQMHNERMDELIQSAEQVGLKYKKKELVCIYLWSLLPEKFESIVLPLMRCSDSNDPEKFPQTYAMAKVMIRTLYNKDEEYKREWKINTSSETKLEDKVPAKTIIEVPEEGVAHIMVNKSQSKEKVYCTFCNSEKHGAQECPKLILWKANKPQEYETISGTFYPSLKKGRGNYRGDSDSRGRGYRGGYHGRGRGRGREIQHNEEKNVH